MPARQPIKCRENADARAAATHKRAASLHDEAAKQAHLVGDIELEARERQFAAKERKAAKRARAREASAVAALVALGL